MRAGADDDMLAPGPGRAEVDALRAELARMERALEVERALDRVRARATAMTRSTELSDASSVLFQQFRSLEIGIERASVGIFDDPAGAVELWTTFTTAHEEVKMLDYVSIHAHPILEASIVARDAGRPYSLTVLSGLEVERFYATFSTDLRVASDGVRPDTEYHYAFFFPSGMLTAIAGSQLSEADCAVMERFASVFGLMYRRFRDLQLSEAAAREAQWEASLGRIRAEVASMRLRSDLERITPLVWSELTAHEVPFIRCGVFIMDEEHELVRTYLSTPGGEAIAQVDLRYDLPYPLVSEGVAHWRRGSVYTEFWDRAAFTDFWGYLASTGAAAGSDDPPEALFLHLVPFLQGMLYVGSPEPLEDDELRLLQSVAEVFTTAYARFEDFSRLEAAKKEVERSLEELKSAQDQLVHAEKMASLGELTAGIAHEIQNPLNFVNNFSEVARELLEEMEDGLDRGDQEAARALAREVSDNLGRITAHGRRADAIVKGMLQHSRSGSGDKEPTDLNALVDEYVRLAFHGIRAKDTTFSASIVTDLDPSVRIVSLVPQDVGRVMLNLLSNAFHAVAERASRAEVGYEPSVQVSTRRVGERVEIRVKDNGGGIPPGVQDKIFQPFFTTKPSGQGTGLGLSLSHDIVTKGHAGHLSVRTEEGDGTEFLVDLPGTP